MMELDAKWNWQLPEWPKFSYDSAKLAPFENEFLRHAGMFMGAVRHVNGAEKEQLTIELIGEEALHTSEIEGEILNRESLQSSLRRNFGLATDGRKVPPAEEGIAKMMTALYQDFAAPLTDDLLFLWHRLLLNGRLDVREVGQYRSDSFPMQVVSGPLHAPSVHFEAPPSAQLFAMMGEFLSWFTTSGLGGSSPLPILTRAGLAHLYFVCIHPFEDGNGRIGRAIAEKAISEGIGEPTLIALSRTINAKRKLYYEMLQSTNRKLEVTDWLLYFAKSILDAQQSAQRSVEFLIGKAKYHERFRDQFNTRQEKVVARVLQEGIDGFEGGLSAENYMKISGASRATATRDLNDLVLKGALRKTGTLKSTRYFVHFGQ